MRLRRTADRAQRRRAVASVGPLDATTAGLVHARLADALGPSVGGLPVEVVGPVDELDAPTLFHHWRAAVFHLDGDAGAGGPVYRAAWTLPGLLVLHAIAIDEVVRSLATVDQPMAWTSHREIAEARAGLGRDPMAGFVPSASPSVAAIARRARGIVVFAEDARTYLEAIGCRTPVHVLAPPVVDGVAAVEAARAAAAAVRASLTGCRALVVAPTDRAEPEDIDRVLDAVRSLPDDTHIALVGSADPGRDAVGLRPDDPLADRLHVHHDLGSEELLAWLAAADVAADLRRPHHVDVALGVLRALQSGRPLVTTAGRVTAGAPAEASVLMDEGDDLAAVLASVLADDGRRRTVGAAGASFVTHLRTAGAPGFAGAAADAVGAALDPIGPAMLRWAGALADLDATEEHLRAGYFGRYAEALRSFRGSSHDAAEGAGDPLLDSR
jgi:hypothetical protein